MQSPKQASSLLEACLLRIAQQDIISDQQTTHEKQYIVIDGLDECDSLEWMQLVEFFLRIVRSLGADSSRLRVLFVSQHTNQIEKTLRGIPAVAITPTDNKDDIEIYTRRRTLEIEERFGLDAFQVQKIVQDTCREAAGMLSPT